MESERIRIDVARAIEIADKTAREYYKEADLSTLRLEEVELNEDDGNWLITVSIMVDEPPPKTSGFERELMGLAPVTADRVRIYKSFTIDADSGKVKSMRIRKL
jgi:hypothetical protein